MKSKKNKPDSSPYVFQRRKTAVSLNISEKIPWTDKQKEVIQLIQSRESKIIFISGAAGTSKSLIATYCGLNLLQEKKYSDLVYIRSVVESGSSKLGFLPGEVNDKFLPYVAPLLDKLDELLPRDQINDLISKELISGKPVNYLRGWQSTGKYVIADEAQNFNKQELTTILTRYGEFSKMIICGDPLQSDLPNGQSAFKSFYNAFNNIDANANGIFCVEFGTEDIVRSELLKFIVERILEI